MSDLFGDKPDLVAIDFIQRHEPPDGYFVGFSGGKDSVVLLDLVERSGVKFEAGYSATGIDPPELVRFIRDKYPAVKWFHPEMSFFAFILKKGFPTKRARWCCDKLKKDPTKDRPRHRLLGIRAEESGMRAKRPQIEQTRHPNKQFIYKPIFYWKTWQIWEHIEERELPYCSLYDEGFERLGCVICPFLCRPNQGYLNQHRQRWPAQYRAFEKAMRKLWDDRESIRQVEKGYADTFEEFLQNWYHGNPSKTDEAQEHLFDDDSLSLT